MKKLARNTQGFTLVELMIVVAIIGILAAIAIPQFTAYRIRGFNSAALSDLRNTSTAEAGMFANVQSFGVTVGTVAIANPMVYAGSVGGVGALVTGPPVGNTTHTIQITPNGGIATGMNIGISTGVTLMANTDVVAALNPRAASFIVAAKHLNGDTYFAQDSDSETIYQDIRNGSNGTLLVVGVIPASTQGTDQIINTAGLSGQLWQAK